MSQSWEETTGEATYAVRVGSDFEVEFSTSGESSGRRGLQGESETIWVEEFPDHDRWQRWVREHLGAEEMVEIQNAVASQLEELAATRKQVFATAVEDLYADEAEVRGRAIDRVRSLAQRYDDLAEHAIEELGGLLDSDEEELRRGAAESLRRVAETHPEPMQGAREPLERALRDDHPNVRLDAARTLLVLAAPEGEEPDFEMLDRVVETLVGLLHEHTRWFSRGPVAGLLGELGREHPRVIEPAVEPLARFIAGELSSGSGTSGIGRSTAVQALVEIGRAESGLLVEHADVFFDQIGARRPGVRGHCAEALGLLGAHEPDLAGRAAEALEELLDDTDFVRSAATEALRRIRESSPAAVERMLSDDQLDAIEETSGLPA